MCVYGHDGKAFNITCAKFHRFWCNCWQFYFTIPHIYGAVQRPKWYTDAKYYASLNLQFWNYPYDRHDMSSISSHLISSHPSPLASEVVGSPQMMLQQYLSTLPCPAALKESQGMRQSACLVVNPVTVNNFASHFNCTPGVGRQTQWWPRHKAIYFSWLVPEVFCLLLGPSGFNCWLSFAPVFQWCCSIPRGSPVVGRNTLFLSSPHLFFIIIFIHDLFVSSGDPLMS